MVPLLAVLNGGSDETQVGEKQKLPKYRKSVSFRIYTRLLQKTLKIQWF